jgi:hypothetical protein
LSTKVEVATTTEPRSSFSMALPDTNCPAKFRVKVEAVTASVPPSAL